MIQSSKQQYNLFQAPLFIKNVHVDTATQPLKQSKPILYAQKETKYEDVWCRKNE